MQSSAIAGILSMVAFVLAIMLVKWPGGGDSNAEVASDLADSGSRAQQYAAGYLLAASALLFLWFLVALRQRLLEAEGAPSRLTDFGVACGVVFATLLLGAGAATVAMPGTISFGDGSGTPDTIGSLGWVAGTATIFSMLPAAMLVLVSSLLTLQRRAFAAWFGWLGLVVVVALLASLLFITMVALPIWVIVVSALLLARR